MSAAPLDPGTSFASRPREVRGRPTSGAHQPMVDGRRGAHDAFRVRRVVGVLAVLGSIVVVVLEMVYCTS